MRFKHISRNRLTQRISNHIVSGYIVSGNLLCLYSALHKVIIPLDVLGLPMKFQILDELDGSTVVTQYLNGIINSWNEIEILNEISKPYCLLSSNTISNILYLHSWQNYAILLLTIPWYGSLTLLTTYQINYKANISPCT